MSDYKQRKFFTLLAAAYSVAADLEEGEERVATYLKWAIDGFREFQFNTAYYVDVAEIAMKPNKQIDWPEDMVDWSMIGFKSGDTIKVFTNDPSIPKTFETINCEPQENKPSTDFSAILTDEFIPFLGSDFFSSSGSHFYGMVMPHNYRGYFDVDNRLRVFNFKRLVNNINTVYLQYFGDGINYNGQTFVPPQAFKCLQKYIHWQRKEHSDEFSDSAAQRAKEIYEDAFDEVLVMNLKLSLEDIKEALRSELKQTPKS